MKNQVNNKKNEENTSQINHELRCIKSENELYEKIFEMIPEINMENLIKAKTIIEIYITHYEELVKARFRLSQSQKYKKLLCLSEALTNHQKEEVYKRIVNDTEDGFCSWARRKNMAAMAAIEENTKRIAPKYINQLIEQGYIADDGKTVLASLDDVAEFLFTIIDSVTPKLLVNTFRQCNGKKYTLRAAQDAIQRTKPQ